MSSDAAFTLRLLTPGDTRSVRRLWSHRFGGARAVQEKWMEAALTPTHPVAGFVAEAAPSEDVVGFALLDVAGRDHTRQYLGLDVLDLSPPIDDRNGLFHMCCVRADWEGHGIGSAFYRRRLRVLADRSVPRAFGISWHRPHPSRDSRMLFEKWGFEAFATVERYYARTDSRKHCPACGGVCTCTASLYTRTIETL